MLLWCLGCADTRQVKVERREGAKGEEDETKKHMLKNFRNKEDVRKMSKKTETFGNNTRSRSIEKAVVESLDNRMQGVMNKLGKMKLQGKQNKDMINLMYEIPRHS